MRCIIHQANRFILTLGLVHVLSSCATIVSGTDQKITFESEPEEARVSVNGKVLGETPITVPVDKDKNQVLKFEKDGFKTYETQLSTSMNGWFWGNIVLGGLFGSTTDGLSGAMYEYSPDQYFVTLTPDGNAYGMTADKTRSIKEILVAFGDEIRYQLNTVEGEELNTLLAILDIKEDRKETTILVLKKLADSSDDNLEFAKKIIDFYDVN